MKRAANLAIDACRSAFRLSGAPQLGHLPNVAWTIARTTDTVPTMADEKSAADPETRVASFFAKYDAARSKLGKALRAKLRARLSSLLELVYVYERQESLVFSYSTTEAGANGVCALSVYPTEVKLFFTGGEQLSKADPNKLLQGRGPGVRHIAMTSIADFDRPEIEALITAALKLGKVNLDPGAKGPTIIKADEQKQRAQRAKKTAKAAPPSRKPKRAR